MDLTRYSAVTDRVASALGRSGRSLHEVTLVAVSKGHPVSDIARLYEFGHRDFGENRASELAEKAAVLPDDIRWHFVGSLQSNKTRLVRSPTWLLHSMDRASLAKAWAKGMGDPPPVLLQVDVGDEEQKGGAAPDELDALCNRATGLGIEVRGLMAIPPQQPDPELVRPYFIRLRELSERLEPIAPGAVDLSMGMTDDFEVAIEEGASLIRVGTAIFGPRHLQD